MHDQRQTDESVGFSPTQRQRLVEIGLTDDPDGYTFGSLVERDRCFEDLSREFTQRNLERLGRLRTGPRRPETRLVEAQMVGVLVRAGFVEVTTPLIIGKGSLAKVGLGDDHPLWRQVYWVDRDRCLRPMLAPSLYQMLSHLQRLWAPPVRIFEVGPCFRKESKGSNHLSEFTMLNLVELEPEAKASERLRELAGLVMEGMGLEYELVETDSEVYGDTLDVEVLGVEVASGVAGPHPLDEEWDISAPWAGWGFGIERLAMLRTGAERIHPVARSLVYLDGSRLNVQGARAAGRTRRNDEEGREV
ncbi:MAG: pyrrolysine--tRNA(Pyl) ligase large subunit [Thermoleophilia bacterium]